LVKRRLHITRNEERNANRHGKHSVEVRRSRDKTQGLNRNLPPGKEQSISVPTSATLIYGKRKAVLVPLQASTAALHRLM